MGVTRIKVGPVEVRLIDDDRICQHIAKGETFEPDTLALWARIAGGGGRVLDIGAYTGLFSIAAARLGTQALAVEPVPVNAARIARNCIINGFEPGERIKIVEAAASEAEGTASMGVNENVYLTAGASLLRKSGQQIQVLTVRVDTLASLEGPRIKAIKIDVERFEMAVLAGARETLSADRPHLIVETLTDEAVAAVVDFLDDYEVVDRLDGRNLYLKPR